MDFAIQMRVMRVARGLSQKELANLCGIPYGSISDIESGKTLPNTGWREKIEAALAWPENADVAFAILAGTNGHTQPTQQPATS